MGHLAGRRRISRRLPGRRLQSVVRLGALVAMTVSVAVGGTSAAAVDRPAAAPAGVAAGSSNWTETFRSAPPLYYISDLECPSASVCYINSFPPSKSVDGGTTWTFQARAGISTGSRSSCSSISACVAVDGSRNISSTTDGATWHLDDTDNLSSFSAVADVACPSTTTCFVAGTHSPSAGAAVAVSHDGGRSWVEIAVPSPSPSLHSISCPTESSCRAAGANGVLTTDDGGATWTSASSTPDPAFKPHAVTCPTQLRCIVAGESGTGGAVVLQSVDGGRSWRNVAVSAAFWVVADVACPSADACVLVGVHTPQVGVSAALVETVDFTGGVSAPIYPPGGFGGLSNVSCSGQHCLAAGGDSASATLLVSSNGGVSWSRSASPPTRLLNDLACAAVTRCAAVGSLQASSDSEVALVERTDDAAASWTSATLPGIRTLSQVVCPSMTHCVAAGSLADGRGIYALSDDGGSSWLPVTSAEEVYGLGELQCPSVDHCLVQGYVVESAGVASMHLLTSDDGGRSWASRWSWAATGYAQVSCVDSRRCLMVHFDSVYAAATSLSKSTDGGSTWTPTPMPSGVAVVGPLRCVASGTCDVSVLAGGQASTSSTIDLGASWSASAVVVRSPRTESCASTMCLAVGGGTATPWAAVSYDGSVSSTVQAVPSTVYRLDTVECPDQELCYVLGVGSLFGTAILKVDIGERPPPLIPPPPAPAPPPLASIPIAPWTIRPNPKANPEDFAVGSDQQIYHRYFEAGAYVPWSTLGGLPNGVALSSRQPSWGVNNFNNPELFVRGVDGAIYHDYATPGIGSGWSGLSSLAQPAVGSASDVAIGRNYLNNQEMYVVGNDGQIYHRFATPGVGSGWSGWDPMGGPAGTTIRSGVHVGRNEANDQELYVVGSNGVLYHNFATPGRGTGWNGWDPMASIPGVSFAGDVNIGLNFLGHQELYAVGSDGSVYHNYATPGLGSGWSTWSSLGAPPAVTLNGAVDLEYFDYRALNRQDLLVRSADGSWYELDSTPGHGSGWSNWAPRS